MKKKTRIATAVCSAVAVAAIGVSFVTGMLNSVSASLDIQNFDGTPVDNAEAKRIVQADAESPLADRIQVFANDGSRKALADVNPESYNGFLAKLDLSIEGTESTRDAAVASGDVMQVRKDLVSADSLETLASHFSNNSVSCVEPNYVVSLFDSGFREDYSDAQQKYLETINIDGAWNKGAFGQDMCGEDDDPTVVAVLDSGLIGTGDGGAGDSKHPDLVYETTGASEANILRGYDCTQPEFVTKDGVEYVTYPVRQTPDSSANNYHGSFVAGELVAQLNNRDAAGVVPKAKVRPYKVFPGTAQTDLVYVIGAIDAAAYDEDVDVISMSLGLGIEINDEGDAASSKILEEACNDAVAMNKILVAACGNDGMEENRYPAAYDSVIGVSATDSQGTFSSSSNYGSDNVFVSAPGSGITGITLGGTASLSGTSMACPLVSGAAALARSYDHDMTAAEFKQLLQATSTYKGDEKYYGCGIVNYGAIAEALATEETPDADNTGISGTVRWTVSGTAPNCKLSLSPIDGAREGFECELALDGNDVPWSAYATSITSVEVTSALNAGTNLRSAFAGFTNLKTLDLSKLSTEKVEDWTDMLAGAESIETIKVGSKWAVKQMPEGQTQTAPTFPNIANANTCAHWSKAATSDTYAIASEIPAGAGEYTATDAHVAVADEGVPATCTTPGQTEGTHCALCDQVLSGHEEIPAAHKFGEGVVHKSTCIMAGYTEYECSVCHYKKQDNFTDKAAHHVSAGAQPVVPEKPATCEEPGTTAIFECETEGCTERIGGTEIQPSGHETYEAAAAVAATCEQAGHTALMKCHKCDWQQGGEAIKELGHKWKTKQAEEQPTCTKAGHTEISECSVCGATSGGDEIAMIDHVWAQTSARVAPDCENDGAEAVETCSMCRASRGGEPIAASGHDYSGTPDMSWTSETLTIKHVCKNNAAHVQENVVEVKSKADDEGRLVARLGEETYERFSVEGTDNASGKIIIEVITSEEADGLNATASAISSADESYKAVLENMNNEAVKANPQNRVFAVYNISLKSGDSDYTSIAGFKSSTLEFHIEDAEQYEGRTFSLIHGNTNTNQVDVVATGVPVKDGKVRVSGITSYSPFALVLEAQSAAQDPAGGVAPPEGNNGNDNNNGGTPEKDPTETGSGVKDDPNLGVPAASLTYKMLEGANASWVKGSTAGLVFRSEADFTKFKTVVVDDKTLARDSDYTVSSGSTVVELQPIYLETLPAGTHSIAIQSTDGSATCKFTVAAAGSAEDPSDEALATGAEGKELANTSDKPTFALLMIGGSACLAAFAAWLLYFTTRRKKRAGK